ncbi:thiamine diphosphokinase [Rhodosalinus sp. 5P4]|uniref:thiamine diphosphokinase n=1 Tax=Rhodosalinus sp. 5P4 TaxID=3239196 RepID=UPI0035232ACB
MNSLPEVEILRSDGAVTLVGAGVAPPADIAAALTLAPCLVAADGGAARALAAGAVPEAVIGDLDSLDPATRAAIPPERLHCVSEQETTDFDKALRRIAAPLVIGVGFLGERLDHLLAAQSVLLRRADRPCLLLGERDVAFLCPPRLGLDLAADTRVSLYPLAPVRGESDGLFWPIDGIDFAPGGMIGTSNRATGPVSIRIEAPHMLVILPRRCLAVAAAALQAPLARWPAPA